MNSNWTKPNIKNETKLQVYNTLTKEKNEFIPENSGKLVRWYACGPTVYDAAHMGHARNYISTDIIRRLLKDYFGYNIQFIMNITDIDDKIIIRAREKYFSEKFFTENTELTNELVTKLKNYLFEYINNYIPKALLKDNAMDENIESIVDNFQKLDISPNPKDATKIQFTINTWKALKTFINERKNPSDVISKFSDIIGPILDKEYGHTISDPAIFRKLSSYWEHEFLKDMDCLNIQRPDVLTRVSEYIPEIIKCIEKIEQNGYTYTINESVYFDIKSFHGHSNHYYAKLCPNSVNRDELNEEGEGALSNTNEKRSVADFALWKNSKPGEPAWDSPWGKGRPGWHIECSAMAGDIASGVLDIHSGGIDLAFPHHDNELAQSEAQFENTQWVNYFLHMGHLHIEEQKMSKSLKNFITIEEALLKYTSRQLRFLFLTHTWSSTLDYKESSMNETIQLERYFNNFFDELNALILENQNHLVNSIGVHYYHDLEKQLFNNFNQSIIKIHEALSDSFDTPTMMKEFQILISNVRKYIKLKENEPLQIHLLKNIGLYITKLFKIVGLIEEEDKIGFMRYEESSNDNIVHNILSILSNFRDSIRSVSKSALHYIKSMKDKIEVDTLTKIRSFPLDILKITDKLRDEDLLDLNILLEDRDNKPSLIKIVDKTTISNLKTKKTK